RAWWFRSDDRGASLHPISDPSTAAVSAWDGANRNWVSAKCRFEPPFPTSDTDNSSLANVFAKLAAKGVLPLLPSSVRHSAPDEACTCGFYAMKEFRFVRVPDGHEVVLGKVAFAGKVIEHSLGYRAERARILELIPVPGKERSVMRLALQL